MTRQATPHPATAARTEIRFLLNDQEVRLGAVSPDAMLLGYIREAARLTGTKEGCNEGDCGACTVLIGRRSGDSMRYTPVNACIRPLASVDLAHVVTVEHLSKDGMHPVQDAMMRHHGSQCGFCTPGIVMALYALWRQDQTPDEATAREALQGNLCRCTGYAPILRAAGDMAGDMAGGRDALDSDASQTVARLTALDQGQPDIPGVILPKDADALAACLLEHPEATLVAGATDVGLWVTKHMTQIAPAIHIGHLDDLAEIKVTPDRIEIGATATYTDLMPVLTAEIPALIPLWRRIGGAQVRAAGTIGGNIANGSPIGDTPPAFIALGADLVLRKGSDRRKIPLEQFFIEYGKQDLHPSEFIEKVIIDKPGDDIFAVHKISKRRDEDISTLLAAARIAVKDGEVRAARLAFGGMAATPRRAPGAEAALIGQPWSVESIIAAQTALDRDFAPISDMRASAEYRRIVARNLLMRIFEEAAG